MWYVKFVQAKFHDRFCTITICFVWPNFLSMGIVNISFQSAGTGKYATPTKDLSFPFKPLVVSYKLSHSEIKDNWISCHLNLTVHSSILLATSTRFTLRKGPAKAAIEAFFSEVAGTSCDCSKLVGELLDVLGRMTSGVTDHVCITSSFGLTR